MTTPVSLLAYTHTKETHTHKSMSQASYRCHARERLCMTMSLSSHAVSKEITGTNAS